MCHRQMDRQTDGQTNRTRFIGPIPMSFDHNLQTIEHKIF